MVLEGDGDGIVEAAAHFAGLDDRRALFHAGDLDDDALRDRARSGARIVFTDSNRRRNVSAGRITENRGATVGPEDALARDVPSYELFDHGSADQTVAVNSGLRYLRSPSSPTFAYFPEQRPYAAFDGRLDQPWIASAQKADNRWIEVALARPRPVESIRIHPHDDELGRTLAVDLSVNGGAERRIDLRAGWNTVPVRAERLERLRMRVARVEDTFYTGRGGLDEVEIPGLRIEERLRTPTHMAAALRGTDLSRNELSILLQRTTADVPYRAGKDIDNAQAENRVHMLDAELGMERRVALPAARTFAVEGWASVSPAAADPDIDRLAGVPSRWRFASSSRFEGLPGHRASSAFDRANETSWVGDWLKGRPAWIALRGPRAVTIRSFRIRGDSRGIYAHPAHVRVTTDEGRTPPLRVSRDGSVRLPRAVHTRSLRIDIADVLQPVGLKGARLLAAVAIAEVRVPGLTTPRPDREGAFATRCGSLAFSAGASHVRGRVRGGIYDLDRGAPLRFEQCGSARGLSLRAGDNDIDAPAGALLRPDHVRLISAPTARDAAAPPPGRSRVVSGGAADTIDVEDATLSVGEPSWLVLAQSWSSGWRAWCTDANGHERDLGEPEPIEGYANGWRVDRGCASARFAWVPQRWADASYVVSAVGALIGLVVLAFGLWRHRRRSRTDGVPAAAGADPAPFATLGGAPPLPDPVRRLDWRRAFALALAVGLIGGFVFAWRAGGVLAAGALVGALVGVSSRRLLLFATAAFVLVPLMYLYDPAPDLGGFFFGYAYWHIEAHWVAVVGVCALLAAALLDAAEQRRRTSPLDAAEDPQTDAERRAAAIAS